MYNIYDNLDNITEAYKKVLQLNEDRDERLGAWRVTSRGGAVKVSYNGKIIATGDFDRDADVYFLSHKKTPNSFSTVEDILKYFKDKNLTESAEDLQELSPQKRWELEQEYKDEERVARMKRNVDPLSVVHVYLNIPYKQKDDFKKKYRVFWDSNQKQWYIKVNTSYTYSLVTQELYDVIDRNKSNKLGLEKIKIKK